MPQLMEGKRKMLEKYALPERLDTATAPGLADALRGRLGEVLMLDGAAVSKVGALGLQVLVAAVRQWREDGKELTLENPSDALLEGCKWLGISPADIGCPDPK